MQHLYYLCNVKRCVNILFLAFFLAAGTLSSIFARETTRPVRIDSARMHRTLSASRVRKGEVMLNTSHLASSNFPVKLHVKGSSLCVASDYNQLLPIYTNGGTLYVAMRLNKGMNWLNGLPRGRYVINNQRVNIP